MHKKSDIERVFVDGMHVDDEGLKLVKTFKIEEVQELGVKDMSAFVSGLLDAENDKEFNDSAPDYVKGYRYGKTGTF